MNTRKRYAAAFLLAGLTLALATPLLLGRAESHLGPYLLQWELFLCQTVPYLLCAALWLPWRGPLAAQAAPVVAGLLLLAAAIVYLPMLLAPRLLGGDMVGLLFLLISVVTTAGVIVVSVLAVIITRLRKQLRASAG